MFKQVKQGRFWATFSSHWNNGLNVSEFYWNLNNGSANRNRNHGRQQVSVCKTVSCFTLPLGKTYGKKGLFRVSNESEYADYHSPLLMGYAL